MFEQILNSILQSLIKVDIGQLRNIFFIYICIERQIDRQKERQIDRYTDRKRERGADRKKWYNSLYGV